MLVLDLLRIFHMRSNAVDVILHGLDDLVWVKTEKLIEDDLAISEHDLVVRFLLLHGLKFLEHIFECVHFFDHNKHLLAHLLSESLEVLQVSREHFERLFVDLRNGVV